MCAGKYTYVQVCTCVEVRETPQLLFFRSHHFYSLRKGLTLLAVHQVSEAAYSENSRDPLVSSFPALGLQVCARHA